MATSETTLTGVATQQAYAIGVTAYIWGYPMVIMQRSRDAMTKAAMHR